MILFYSALFLRAQEEEDTPVKEKFYVKTRMVEVSLANVSFNVSNNVIAASDIFKNPFYMISHAKEIKQDPALIYQDPIVVNIDDFFNGFLFSTSASIKPVSLNFNWKDEWGIGLDIAHITAWGNVAISDKVLSLKETKEKFGGGGAVFADVGLPFFFHYNDFKIKLRPAVYVPVVYMEPGITYNYKTVVNSDTGLEGVRLEIDYDMRIYTVVDIRGTKMNKLDPVWRDLQDNYWNILRNNLGYDFGLCVEYPLDNMLDIGLDIVNIPVPYAGAKLNHFSRLQGEAFFDTSEISLADLIEDGKISEDAYGYPDNFEFIYGYNSKGKKMYRPFTMLFFANYRPNNSRILSLIPSLGFSINRMYPKPGAVEGGLSARFDVANIFFATLGVNYNDRGWKNSVDFILNLRAFELDFGLSSQAPTFIKSWQGAGVGVNFGMKFGW